jgi:hypothetical protein
VEERKEKKGEVSLIKKVKYLNRIGNKIFEGIV